LCGLLGDESGVVHNFSLFAHTKRPSMFAPSPPLRKSTRAAPTKNVTVTYTKNTFAMVFRSMYARARAFTDIHRQTV